MFESLERGAETWSPEHARDWYLSRPRPFGVTFLPSYACNSTEMWMSETFNLDTLRRELGWVGEAGFNCVRVFCPYIVWKLQGYAFADRFETLLALAKEVGLTVLPVLFDDLSLAGVEPFLVWQPEPRPGIRNASWTPSPGTVLADDLSRYDVLREYVQAMVGAYHRDERVLFWDLYNLPGWGGRGANSLYLLRKTFDWARSCQPVQPLTAGVWQGDPADVGLRFCQASCLEFSDLVTFCQYDGSEALSRALEQMEKLGLPMVCTGWFARTRGSVYTTHLPLFQAHDAGCIQTGFVNGRTQEHIPPDWDPEGGEPPVWYRDNIRPNGEWYNPLDRQALREFAESCIR